MRSFRVYPTVSVSKLRAGTMPRMVLVDHVLDDGDVGLCHLFS